jgi:DNA-binding response OmpR family regulator
MSKHILVIDDDESILEVVQIVLEIEGYDVQTSPNGDCLQLLDSNQPDLILLDVLLSGEDGRELCRRLKSNRVTRNIPVIMLSAHSQAHKMADMNGADAFLEKPFDVDVLLATVRHCLNLSGGDEKLRA